MNDFLNKLEKSNVLKIVQGIMVSFAICITFSLATSNILYLIVGGLYLILTKYEVELEKKEKWVNMVLSGLFSLFMVMGNIETIFAVDFLLFWPLTFILCWIGIYLCFSFLIAHMLVYFRTVKIRDGNRVTTGKSALSAFLISFVSLLFVWGIGFAVSYPGNTTSDSNQIINMALGKENMEAAVPVIYVMAIRYLWNFGFAMFGTPNASLAVCTFAHILMISVIISYLICKLYSYNVKKWICVIVWLFYAFVPYNVQLSHTIWKDIPFSAFVFLVSVLVWEQYMESAVQSKMQELCRLIFLIIAAIGMCLMRSNGLFAYIFFLPFGLFLFFKKNKKVVVALLIAFVLVRVIQGPVSDKIMNDNALLVSELQMESKENATDTEEGSAKTTEKAEAPQVVQVKNATDSYNSSGIFIVTIQQLARVAVDRELSQEEYLRMSNVLDVEEIRETYEPHCRDAAGWAMNHGISTADYLKEWVYFGLKYPIEYILAYKDQTYGYWYPDIQYWVYTDQIKENDNGLYRDSILSDDDRYEMMLFEELYKEIPIYGMLWSIGFVVWTTLFFMGITFIKKGLREMILYFPVLGVWATLLVATPVYAEFRYIYAIFLCLPLSILIPFIVKEESVTESK